MNLKDCFEKGLLKKTKIEKEKIINSIDLAKHFLERAKGNYTNNYFDVAFLMAYNSMFHSARALLFSKGYKERSHYCLIAFLQKEFSNEKELQEFIKVLDSYRRVRHSIQYSGELCSETDAHEAIDDCSKFLDAVKLNLSKRKLI